MKTIAKYILMAGVALMATACDKDSVEAGEGVVSFDIRMSNETRAEVNGVSEENLPEYLRVKIYNQEGLIRRYTSLSDIPNPLYLVAGDYSVKAEAGDKENVAFLQSEVTTSGGAISKMLCYESESIPFTVEAHKSTDINVTAKTINVKTAVNFNTEVAENNKLSEVKIQLAAMTSNATTLDGFNAAITAATPKVEMTGTDVAYFLLPEGEADNTEDDVTTILWSFEGTHSDDGAISKVGTIAVAKGKGYTVNFVYSRTPDGFIGPDGEGNGGLYVEVSDEVDEMESDFDFKPQPEISGPGLNMSAVNVYAEGSDITLVCESIYDLKTLSLGGVKFFDSGTPNNNAIPGISSVVNTPAKVTITIAKEYFANLKGGENILTFEMVDENTDEGDAHEQSVKFLKQGLVVDDIIADLWANTATFSAVVTDNSVTNVGFKFRKTGTDEWSEFLPASYISTENGCKIYSATSTASWIEGINRNGHTIYTPNVAHSIFAGNTYQVQTFIDGNQYGKIVEYVVSSPNQIIPGADFEDANLSCWGNDTGIAPFWGSGNNNFTKDDPLCRQATFNGMIGNYCARLSSCAAGAFGVNLLAAGNIFTGTFNRPSTTGTVSFGVQYKDAEKKSLWKARPTSLKLKYYTKLGKIDRDDKSMSGKDAVNKLTTGDPDYGSIYVAIVDWNSRHGVASGTGNPTGMWSPEDGMNPKDSQGEHVGKIIGYGVVYPRGTTNGDSMIDLEIPIHYYDKVSKPSEENYTLVISAATSRYGDYMLGCSNSDMYLDNFQWGFDEPTNLYDEAKNQTLPQ